MAPIVSNCMVIGDKKKFLSLVCTLRCTTINEQQPTDELDWIAKDQCKKLGSDALTGKHISGSLTFNFPSHLSVFKV